MGREIPSLTEYLSGLNDKQQAQAELMILLAPFLAGYSVFLYNWIVLWKPIEESIGLPSVITSIGYILYYRWRDAIRSEAQALDAISLKIRWNAEYAFGHNNVVASKMPLLETDLFNSADPAQGSDALRMFFPPSTDPNDPDPVEPGTVETVNFGDQDISKDILIGRYYEKMVCENYFVNPATNQKTKVAVFIMDFPFDKTFRKTAGHFFSYKGQLFPINAGDVDCTFIGYKEELELVFFFRVTSSQERTRLMQIGLGLVPATSNIDEVNRARRLDSTTEAIKERLRANKAEGLVKVLTENYPDAEADSYRGANRVLRDLDKIREKNNPSWRSKINWTNVLIGLVALVGVYFWYTEYYLTDTPLVAWVMGAILSV